MQIDGNVATRGRTLRWRREAKTYCVPSAIKSKMSRNSRWEQHMSEQAPVGRRGVGYHAIRQQTITALAVFLLLGTLGIAWNKLSHGGLVRLLGGVTQSDLEAFAQPRIRPAL